MIKLFKKLGIKNNHNKTNRIYMMIMTRITSKIL